MGIRSGRFRKLNETSDGDRVIVKTANKKNGGNVYRILNSGEIPLTVETKGATRSVDLNNSLDVMIEDGEDLEVRWTIPVVNSKPVPSDIRCAYNFLGDENGSLESMNELRSGRFTGTPNAGNKVIVDITGGSSQSAAFYRLFNSGDADVVFAVTDVGDITLEPKSSVDVALGSKGTISVQGAVPVDVIYDLLGGVNG